MFDLLLSWISFTATSEHSVLHNFTSCLMSTGELSVVSDDPHGSFKSTMVQSTRSLRCETGLCAASVLQRFIVIVHKESSAVRQAVSLERIELASLALVLRRSIDDPASRFKYAHEGPYRVYQCMK